MIDSDCDLAALVYEEGDSPDELLCAFADDLHRQGFRVVGLVQQRDHRAAQVSVRLLHTSEKIELLQDFGKDSAECRLDVGRLLEAGRLAASALDHGADLVVINRFGRLEGEGKGLLFLLERALAAEIPILIAVQREHYPAWITFSGGMSVILRCDRDSLERWWRSISGKSEGHAPREA